MVGELSLALGEIPPNTVSKIHIHPVVSQLTWVVSGELTIKMKDPSDNAPYILDLKAEESVFTEAGTFFQLINNSSESCRVLYVVSPAFLFEINKDGVVSYNDAIVLDEGWDTLPEIKNPAKAKETRNNAWKRFIQK